MPELELIDAVARKTGEDSHEIRRRGFVLTTADELGIRQASNLIDELKSHEPTSAGSNGNWAHAAGGAR